MFFEKLIAAYLKFYGVDAGHYFNSPVLTWEAMLKITRVKLAKISDIDKYLLKKDSEKVFLTLIRDTLKQVIST